jgi:hypothetical protein
MDMRHSQTATAPKPWSKRLWLFLALAFLLLFSSFRWNVFHIEETRTNINLGVDGYVIPTMELYAAGPALQRNLGELRLFRDDGSSYPYIMLAGLQRILYSAVSPHTAEGVDRSIPYLRSAVAAALALTFTAFLYIVAGEFGFFCAGITAILLAWSNWLIVFAPDLLWISALFFVPFVLAWLWGDPTRSVKQQRLLAGLFTLFCIVKCLCGFDYTTNICAAVSVPFLYYGLRRGQPLRNIAARILRYGALSVLAFCCALSLQIVQLLFVEKVPTSGIRAFFAEARMRTMSNGEGMSSGYDHAVLSVLHRLHFPAARDASIAPYLHPLRPVLRYLRYLTMGAVTIPSPFHSLQIPIALFVVGFIVALWLLRKRLRAQPNSRASAWGAATLAALVISHLWVVAANGHMTHTFFNAIVFYIPFLPMAYVAVAIACVKLRDDLRRRKLHRRQELSV